MTDWLDSASSCQVATTGRRSGKPHLVTVWFVAVATAGEDEPDAPRAETRTVYAISRDGPAGDWVRNLIAQPAVTIVSRKRRHPGLARLVDDAGEHEAARRAMHAKYSPRHRALDVWLSAASATVVAVDLGDDASSEASDAGM